MKYDVTATRQELSALADIKAHQTDLIDWLGESLPALPDTANTATTSGIFYIYWIGEDHWIWRTTIDQEPELINQLNLNLIPENISAVLISDTLTFFDLSGVDADQIVSIASPLDIHPSIFPPNGVTYTEVFGLKALLIRTDTGFEIAIDRSYADMLEDYLNRAGAVFD